MENIEVAKNVLSGMIESGAVTEGQVVAEIIKHGIDYHTALDSLRKAYREVGAERSPSHSGAVIAYRKSKKELDLQETPALEMAKRAAQSSPSERKAAAILDNYRR